MTDNCGAPSSSITVTWAAAVPRVAFSGRESVNANVSFGSFTASSTSATDTVLPVPPGANVSSPAAVP